MAALTDRWWMAGRRSASETADPWTLGFVGWHLQESEP
jgi:hypothetical protein